MLRTIIADSKAAVKLLLQRSKKRKSGPIRVGFMCQYIPAWNKAEPIYAAMKEDARFTPFLLCIPSGISANKLLDPESVENDTYAYYVQQGYDAVNMLTGKNEWLPIETLDLDFVIYLRPYNDVMPIPYLSGVVSRYAKICVIMYGICIMKEDMDIMMRPDFFRDVYCFLADSAYAASVGKRNYPLTHALGLQKSVYHGIPAMLQIMQDKGKPTAAWDFSENSFRIMWTPRWTTDLKLGGSNFFVYKDWLLSYVQEKEDAACLLRPHPMAFDNFIKTGEMTESEVAAYKAYCEALPNVQIDERKEYVSTMWASSVLVTDYSGIVPEYFVMDKPLIFCTSNMILQPTEFTRRMLQGCYLADNEEELERHLENLRAGNDYLRETRKEIIQELFGETLYTSVRDILDELAGSV